MTIHNMHLHAEPFAQFKSGKKKIELRVNDPKRQAVELGDGIIFTSRESGQKLAFKVIGRVLFRDFETLVDYLGGDKCGFTKDSPTGYKKEWMGNIYSKADVEKYGALGIVVEPVVDSCKNI
ncbi:MAG: ASCH domain-containing protein [Alphaproteobacteria bacterium]|nr:ASCH domain-containing protein [Alphaproteobacteria bacterium]